MIYFFRRHFQREGLSILLASLLAAVTAILQNAPVYLILLLLTFGVFLCVFISQQSWEEKSETRLDKLDDRFAGLSSARVAAALHLLGKKEDKGAVEDVIDFFEDVGFHLKNYRLEQNEVYHRFAHYIQIYYESAYDRIIERLTAEGDTWEHLPYLYTAILKVKAKRVPSIPQKLPSDKLKEFLEIEANLL